MLPAASPHARVMISRDLGSRHFDLGDHAQRRAFSNRSARAPPRVREMSPGPHSVYLAPVHASPERPALPHPWFARLSAIAMYIFCSLLPSSSLPAGRSPLTTGAVARPEPRNARSALAPRADALTANPDVSDVPTAVILTNSISDRRINSNPGRIAVRLFDHLVGARKECRINLVRDPLISESR
jgi:hypothetical protein